MGHSLIIHSSLVGPRQALELGAQSHVAVVSKDSTGQHQPLPTELSTRAWWPAKSCHASRTATLHTAQVLNKPLQASEVPPGCQAQPAAAAWPPCTMCSQQRTSSVSRAQSDLQSSGRTGSNGTPLLNWSSASHSARCSAHGVASFDRQICIGRWAAMI